MTNRGVKQCGVGSTSTSLLQRAQQQQPEAWDRLVTLYGPLIYSWACRWGCAPQAAENLGQETFLRIWKNLGAFRRERPGDTFQGWIYRIAENVFLDSRRRAGRELQGIGGSAANRLLTAVQQHEGNSEVDGDRSSQCREDAKQLYRRAVEILRSEFSERDWMAFSEVVMHGRLPRDVAEELNTTPNVVYLAKSRLLRRLRVEFADLIDDDLLSRG